MWIKKLSLRNFRNYEEAEISFEKGRNLIFGENAQGKTNLIEAVFYLSCLKTFRGVKDSGAVMHEKESCTIDGDFSAYGRDFNISCTVSERGRRLFVNGVREDKPINHIGLIKTVVFSPDDLQLIKEGPSLRRRFMNMSVSQMKPAYIKALSEHKKLLEHKRKILKDPQRTPSMIEFLDVINEGISEKAAFITKERAAFLSEISEISQGIMKEISNGREKISIKYNCASSIEDPFSDENKERLFEHLRRRRVAELESGMCLVGSHRDDFTVCINGLSAREFASQGQIRSATLALKLSEHRLIEKDCGESPILLLDDVLSELDPMRQQFLINDASRGQTLITGCDPSVFSGPFSGKVFAVAAGRVQEQDIKEKEVL